MPCTGDTPHCNESTGACAACVLDAHCDDGVCDDGTCVQCAEDADCVSADAARCDTARDQSDVVVGSRVGGACRMAVHRASEKPRAA